MTAPHTHVVLHFSPTNATHPTHHRSPLSALSALCACAASAHGGGRRCVEKGCDRSARGPSNKCVQHGGGRRCCRPGCPESAVDRKELCLQHGGADAPIVFEAEEVVAEEDLLLELCQQAPRAVKSAPRAKKTKRAPAPASASPPAKRASSSCAAKGARKPACPNRQKKNPTEPYAASSPPFPLGVPLPAGFQRYPLGAGYGTAQPQSRQLPTTALWAPPPMHVGRQAPQLPVGSAPFAFAPSAVVQLPPFGGCPPRMQHAGQSVAVHANAPRVQPLRRKQCRRAPPKSAGTAKMADGMWSFTCPIAPQGARAPGAFDPSQSLSAVAGAVYVPSGSNVSKLMRSPPLPPPGQQHPATALLFAATAHKQVRVGAEDVDADVDIET